MNLFIVILLMNVVHLFGEPILNHQLRGAHKQHQERLIQELFKTTFDSLHKQIIESAMVGQNECTFTIVCQENYSLNCEFANNEQHKFWSHEQHKIWSQNHPFITLKQFRKNVLDALQNSFPDSNFTKTNKNCCGHYSIKW